MACVLAVAAASLAACATSGPKFTEMSAAPAGAGAPGTGRIYFYRTSVLGAAVQPAGNYEVTTSTEVERKLTFTLDEGQTRYVRLSISMGFFVGHVYGELVDEGKGKSEIAETRYTGKP